MAVLDACVLYPAPLRDFLLHIANMDIYQPKWSEIIQEEWTRNLLLNRTDLTSDKLTRTVEAMNKAFPDANISDFEDLIDVINLPDKDDKHVLAAAIKSNAKYIITFNLKDFSKEVLEKWKIIPLNPDDFVTNLFIQFSEEIKKAFENQVLFLKNPPMSKEQVLETLKKCGLEKSVLKLKNLL